MMGYLHPSWMGGRGWCRVLQLYSTLVVVVAYSWFFSVATGVFKTEWLQADLFSNGTPT